MVCIFLTPHGAPAHHPSETSRSTHAEQHRAQMPEHMETDLENPSATRPSGTPREAQIAEQ